MEHPDAYWDGHTQHVHFLSELNGKEYRIESHHSGALLCMQFID